MKCYNIDLSENLKITQMGKETFVPPRTHISRKIKEYIIYLITDGSLSLIHNGENLTLKKNDIFVFDVGDTQAPLNAEFCEYYYIHFVSQKTKVFYFTQEEYSNVCEKKRKESLEAEIFSDECYKYFNVYIKERYYLDKQNFDYLIGFVKNNLIKYESRYLKKRLNISAAVQNMLLNLEEIGITKENKSYYMAYDVAEYIENNYKEKITGKLIEKEFFMNFDYINRVFKKVFGYTIIQYCNRIRIEVAKQKMMAGNIKLSIVATESGFKDIYYFSRVFKKIEGISPTEYLITLRS